AALLAIEGFAAPGRLIAGTGDATAGCGALASLGIEISDLEAAACLSGLPLLRAPAAPRSVALEGVPAAGVGGVEVAAALAVALSASRSPGVVELCGPGVSGLPLADRIAVAVLLRALAGAETLFPSDAVTAGWLEARGRGADWKALARPVEEPADLAVVLD